MKSKHFTTAMLLIGIATASYAQSVELILAAPGINDNIYVDDLGNIFTTSGGLTGGDNIGKYNIQTEVYSPNYADGFAGPISIAPYRDSLFIVTNYDNNTASSYNRNTGEVLTIATGLDGPAGIAIDSEDNIYISNWGASNPQNGKVNKITPQGDVQVYIDSPELESPQGITINHLGELILRSSTSLYKVNAADSSLVFWTEVGYVLGNMTFRTQDSCVYAPGNHKVFRIDADGNVEILAGSVSGFLDGPAETALFHQPLGIDFSPDEETLYIAESGYQTGVGSLRAITMSDATFASSASQIEAHVYPAITSDEVKIVLSENNPTTISVTTTSGQKVLSTHSTSLTTVLRLDELSQGIYIINLVSGVKRGSYKVLLTK